MGFEQPDLLGHVPFEFHHHDDVQATLECSRGRKLSLIIFCSDSHSSIPIPCINHPFIKLGDSLTID